MNLMKHIIIKNIGAIKDVDINLNKVNVIMGPQSSGKSTIAKIISFCQWVEKRYILDGKFEYKFSEIFLNFHRIDTTYFSNDSLIDYQGDSARISCLGKQFELKIEKINNGQNFINHKNIYIPAERNLVSVVPNLGRYKETNDNIMNFVYDWFEAKKKYTLKNSFSILNLGVSYHNVKDDDSDKLILKENNKELGLNNASSGLQSVLPLLILVDYLTKHLFVKDDTLNVKEKKLYERAMEPVNDLRKRINVLLDNEDLEVRKKAESLNVDVDIVEKNVQKVIERFIRYHFTQFIIEEPEQNLSPITQRDLIYHLINKLTKTERQHSLLITTHSPYVLYALNNCMMGYNVRKNIPSKEVESLASKNSWINPKFVSVWETDINTGTLRDIKNIKTGTVDKHYFNEAMNEVMNEYYDMLDHLEL
jgi:energy-coupling factor transporter ATP-binding protein EcfA2